MYRNFFAGVIAPPCAAANIIFAFGPQVCYGMGHVKPFHACSRLGRFRRVAE
jgi:hypothetical protein